MTRATLIAGAAFVAICAVPDAVLGAPATFTFPPGGLIQSAFVSDSTPCAGRPFLLHVVAQHPLNPGTPVEVYIDGAPGRPQMLQFFAASTQRKISLFAITRERLEDRQEITIAVQTCPQVTTTLELLHSRNPYHRDRIDFHAVLRGQRARSYQWSFGDGTTAVTQTPFVSHDFAPELTPSAKFSYFNVIVTEAASNLASGRRIAVGSSFALSRSMGFVQAEVQTAVNRVPQGLIVAMEIANHHTTSVTLNRYVKQYLPCDAREPTRSQMVVAEAVLGSNNAIVHPAGAKSPGRLTVAKNGTVKSRLILPMEDIPPETCALGFNLIGTSTDRKQVYGSFYVKVRQNPLFTAKVTDGATLLTLEQLGTNLLVPDPDEIPADKLHELAQRGFIERTRTGWRRK
jgi:hypothetical protein